MSRFVAQKDHNRIFLYGDLDSSTNLMPLEYLLSGEQQSTTLDCSGLVHVGWEGLHNLYSRLARHREQEKQIHITQMPHHMYRFWRLVQHDFYIQNEQDVAHIFPVDSIEVPYFSQEQAFIGTTWLRPKDLPAFSWYAEKPKADARVDSLFFEAIYKNTDRDTNWDTDRDTDRDAQQATDDLCMIESRNVWCVSHPDETEFTYRYIAYCSNTIALCTITGHDIASSLVQILEKSYITERNLAILSKCVGYALPEGNSFQGSLSVQREMKNCLYALHKVDGEASVLLRKVQKVTQNEALNDIETADQLRQIWRCLSQLRRRLVTLANKLERIALTVGSCIPHTQGLREFRLFLENFSQNHAALSVDALDAIKEAFCILDDSDTLDEILPEILPDFTVMDQHIESYATAVQSFDLIRQILEHRIEECTQVEQLLACFDPAFPPSLRLVYDDETWFMLRDALYETIRKRLVTQQERVTARYFFPDMPPKEAEADPGDMLFF